MGLPRSLVIGQCSEDLVCHYCHQLLTKPVAVSCGHCFCSECVNGPEKHPRRLFGCPVCEAELTYPSEKTVPSWIPIELDTLVIKCPQGCDQDVQLKLLTQHIGKECPKDMIACPNAFAGCKVNVSRATINIHLEKCMYRKVKCSACGQEVINADLFKHQMRRKCHERAMKVDLARSLRRCNSQVKLHNEAVKNDLHRTMQENRKIVLSHWGARGIRGFDKFSDSNQPNGDVTTTPISQQSRAQMVLLSQTENAPRCTQCSKAFRLENNHETACTWHAGPIIETFGGLCLACGRPDHLHGCLLGFHCT